LRAVLAFTLLIQGTAYLRDPASTVAVWGVGLGAIAAGALFLAGLLTPLVGGVTAIGWIALWAFSPLAGKVGILGSSADVVYVASILISVILLGPGAFSADARIFGRREIIIPPAPGLPPDR
jgi:hypothetical protein